MNLFTRVLIILALLAAALPAAAVQAQVSPADPACAAAAMAKGYEYESIWLDGSITCVIYPPRDVWNKEMVLFAHGYVDARQPLAIPWTQLVGAQGNLPEMVLGLGYAFGTTSYRTNGLAVKEGVEDIARLAQHVRTGKNKVRKVYLTGASEGGLVAALALEKHPQLFAAGLSTCGPVGSFLQQAQYWGDFRVAFDTAFPGVLNGPNVLVNPYTFEVVEVGASTPIAIDPLVVQYWELFAVQVVIPALQANPGAALGLLLGTGVPYDPADMNTVGQSILELLYYNVEATNNARMQLNPAVAANPLLLMPPSILGNPYENLFYTLGYPGGITRDPVALAEIMASYETSAKLSRPLVLMHTTGDPVIPISQAELYLQKAFAADKLQKITYLPVERYGHCSFKPAELVIGFNAMVKSDTLIPFSEAQVQGALADPALVAEYYRLLAEQ